MTIIFQYKYEGHYFLAILYIFLQNGVVIRLMDFTEKKMTAPYTTSVIIVAAPILYHVHLVCTLILIEIIVTGQQMFLIVLNGESDLQIRVCTEILFFLFLNQNIC